MSRRVCDTNTGAYCRARLKFSGKVVRAIAGRLAEDAKAAVDHDAALTPESAESSLCPEGVAEAKSAATGGRVLLVDGFTVTAADAPENQARIRRIRRRRRDWGFRSCGASR